MSHRKIPATRELPNPLRFLSHSDYSWAPWQPTWSSSAWSPSVASPLAGVAFAGAMDFLYMSQPLRPAAFCSNFVRASRAVSLCPYRKRSSWCVVCVRARFFASLSTMHGGTNTCAPLLCSRRGVPPAPSVGASPSLPPGAVGVLTQHTARPSRVKLRSYPRAPVHC